MGKKKKFTPRKRSDVGEDTQKANSLSNSEDSDDNEVDYFHSKKDKELFNKSSLSQVLDTDEDEDESDDEIMPFEDESSDSDDNQFEGLNRFAVELKKDEMASDLDESEDEELPDSKAWGNKRTAFYNTDYVDKDFRNEWLKDQNLAKYEEEEALAIQKRLLESISEADVGIDLLVGDIEPKSASNDNTMDELKDEEQQTLQINLKNLTKRQILEILRKESPEFEALVNDFNTYSQEIKDRLLPIIETIKRRNLSKVFSIKYIENRFNILINYLINISFYLALKAKRISVKEHPVIKQILSFKKLLVEMNSIEEKNLNISREISSLEQKLKSEEKINLFKEQLKRQNTSQKTKNSKKVKFSEHLIDTQLLENEAQDFEESEELAKRGITYEIAKNKGLTPKRKKELKNPRVKHRMKYRKAKIRRKGQVREPRKEVTRYGGELSGIKSGVVKSVKFK